jgi:hypothetical protein
MDFDDDHIQDYLEADYIENLIFETFGYTEEELQNIISKYESKIPYNNKDERTAFTLFNGDMTKLDLLDYFNENFNQRNKSFTELTKFNQIFFYFNKVEKISQERYKELVFERYTFNYLGRDIRGETNSHQKTLHNLEIHFKTSH